MSDIIDLTPIGVLEDAAYLLWQNVPLRDLHRFSQAYPDLHQRFLDRYRSDRDISG